MPRVCHEAAFYSGIVLSIPLARRLLSAGMVWEPVPGDRFVMPDRDMDEEVFYISHMVVDVHQLTHGRVIGFNGTTEWALDSLELTDVLWLPTESQLREELGEAFVALTRPGTWQVELTGGRAFSDPDVECAYAQAVLAILDFP